MSNKEDNERIGYGSPPKRTQFKKGQSGCPDGGHAKRRARARAKEERRKKQDEEDRYAFARWIGGEKKLTINGKRRRMKRITLFLAQLEEDIFVKRDLGVRIQFMNMLHRNGFLKPEPAKQKGGGVLVVRQPLSMEDWVRETDGERLTRDPLEGIPGLKREALKSKDRHQRTKAMLDDDDS